MNENQNAHSGLQGQPCAFVCGTESTCIVDGHVHPGRSPPLCASSSGAQGSRASPQASWRRRAPLHMSLWGQVAHRRYEALSPHGQRQGPGELIPPTLSSCSRPISSLILVYGTLIVGSPSCLLLETQHLMRVGTMTFSCLSPLHVAGEKPSKGCWVNAEWKNERGSSNQNVQWFHSWEQTRGANGGKSAAHFKDQVSSKLYLQLLSPKTKQNAPGSTNTPRFFLCWVISFSPFKAPSSKAVP